MQRPWVLVSGAIALLVVAVIVYAWIDGGRRPVQPIAVPVAPEALR